MLRGLLLPNRHLGRDIALRLNPVNTICLKTMATVRQHRSAVVRLYPPATSSCVRNSMIHLMTKGITADVPPMITLRHIANMTTKSMKRMKSRVAGVV